MRYFFGPLLAWFVFAWAAGPEFLYTRWETMLIVFAALNLIPAGIRLLFSENDRANTTWWQMAAILFFCMAWLFERPLWAALGMLPYIVWAVYWSLGAWVELWFGFDKTPKTSQQRRFAWVRAAALSWWAVGAVFSLFAVVDYRPFDFDPMLINLTAAHFHVAGFVLTVVIYALDRALHNGLTKRLAWGAVVGMPLVATGIVLTKLGFLPVLEAFAGFGFAMMAISAALLQLKMTSNLEFTKSVRFLWLLAGIALLGGGILATAYALRFCMPMPWVDIPHMKIWHGTLNTVGFGYLSLCAWQLVANNEPAGKYRRWYAL